MSTYVPGFQSFFMFLYQFVLANLATSRIRVNLNTVVRIYATFNNNLGMNDNIT